MQIDEEFKEETAWFPNYNKKLALLFTDYNEYSNFYSNNYFVEFVINTNNVWFIPNLVINPVGKIENTIEPLINSIRSEEIRGSENK